MCIILYSDLFIQLFAIIWRPPPQLNDSVPFYLIHTISGTKLRRIIKAMMLHEVLLLSSLNATRMVCNVVNWRLSTWSRSLYCATQQEWEGMLLPFTIVVVYLFSYVHCIFVFCTIAEVQNIVLSRSRWLDHFLLLTVKRVRQEEDGRALKDVTYSYVYIVHTPVCSNSRFLLPSKKWMNSCLLATYTLVSTWSAFPAAYLSIWNIIRQI